MGRVWLDMVAWACIVATRAGGTRSAAAIGDVRCSPACQGDRTHAREQSDGRNLESEGFAREEISTVELYSTPRVSSVGAKHLTPLHAKGWQQSLQTPLRRIQTKRRRRRRLQSAPPMLRTASPHLLRPPPRPRKSQLGQWHQPLHPHPAAPRQWWKMWRSVFWGGQRKLYRRLRKRKQARWHGPPLPPQLLHRHWFQPQLRRLQHKPPQPKWQWHQPRCWQLQLYRR